MELKGRRTAVFGLGLSGLSAGRFLVDRGAKVTAVDHQPAGKLAGRIKQLTDLGIEVAVGDQASPALAKADLIVVSPGIPLTQPDLVAARDRGVEIIGEMGLAALHLAEQSDRTLIAVSGTNGKSTTTALIAALLEAAGRKVFLGGNIGRPLIECLIDEPEADYIVAEVSSYQLETMPLFKPKAAVLVNISPDHLDRHGDLETYARIKSRMWADMGPDDLLMINGRDELSVRLARSASARVFRFNSQDRLAAGSTIEESLMHLRDGAGRSEVINLADWKLPGRHNLANLEAAALTAWLLGANRWDIEAGLAAFEALPHRLALAATKAGVDYYNDSKATNVISACAAVTGFDRPVILIAGGLGKGSSYAPLVEAARGRVKAVVLIGQDAPALAKAFSGTTEVIMAETLDRAVTESAALARPGDVVLLAPACASFDQFDNYGARGRAFTELAARLNDD